MSENRSRIVALALFLIPQCIQAQIETQEVFIEGVLRERRDMNRAGQSVTVNPSDESRFDSQVHFKSDPSISLSGNGRAGGFSLPLFRGQDARSSHVFIDDLELQDPYSGFPMVDEVDLRAFGTMVIHKGVSPWNIPVLDPGGVVQFSLRKPASTAQAGISQGDIAGTSGWLKTATPSEVSLDAGLYGRRSTNRGDYKYYSDNNTVLNPSDDDIRRRGNNDRSSLQGLGNISWMGARVGAKGLAWAQTSQQGIPLGLASGDGSARLDAQTQIVTSGVRVDISQDHWVGFDVGGFSGQRAFRDPANDIGFATKRTLKSQSARGRATIAGEGTSVNWLISAERQDSKSTLSSTYAKDFYSPEASAYKIFAGGKYNVFSDQALEVKAGAQWFNSLSQTVDRAIEKRSKTSKSGGGSIGWSRFANDLLLYAQAARASRAPSLLERMGNGAEIDGSASLSNEDSRTLELGMRSIMSFGSEVRALMNFVTWARDNEQVIRIEKISATRWRARNSGAQKFRGVEARTDLGMDDFGLEMAASWMHTEQVANRLLVPFTPIWQGVGGARWNAHEGVSVRAMSRFVGRMYQDVSNTRELTWTLSHDASVDFTSRDRRWKIGASLNNITDVASTTIRDTVTGQEDGRMAWVQYNGEPLPGRSWLISGSASL